MLTIYQRFSYYVNRISAKDSTLEIIDLLEKTIDENTPPILQLPNEILLNIFSYLNVNDLCRCYYVTNRWSRISNDILLWNTKLIRESHNWIGILPLQTTASTENSFKHPKEHYLSFTPIVSSKELVRSGLFAYCSLLFRTNFGYRTPNITAIGSGLDNYKSGIFFQRIFSNQCLEFEPVGQFLPAVGSGFTMKLKTDDNYPYKFHLYMIQSTRPQSKFSEAGRQDQRIRGSCLFNRLEHEQSLSELSMVDPVKVIFSSTDALVYSIDAHNSEHDYKSLVHEFRVASSQLRPDTPILILLIAPDTYHSQTSTISSYQASQIFDLFSLRQPWCILSANVKDANILKLGLIWLIQKIFKI